MIKYQRKLKTFLQGEAPGHHHRFIREKLFNSSNFIILSFFYYFIFTPLSLFLRLSGHTFLRMKLSKGSYWIPKKRPLDYDQPY